MTTITLALLASTLVQQVQVTETLREVPNRRPEFAREPGWDLFLPSAFRLGQTWGVGRKELLISGYSVVDSDGEVLRIHCILAGPGGLEMNAPDFRVVVFDAEGRRYLPEHDGVVNGLGTKTNHMRSAVFSLDPRTITPDRIAYIAVEQVKRAPQPNELSQASQGKP
ncbi:hypothetical protein AB1L88_01255 [Tautonia sp. JC769]|uniref:hypothetical protein n=1 Tax=Tautonia sp. JC769 TaxID=3232135 RepID=UPI00345961D9